MTEKRYDVIYEKEPRGQVVTDNGIPCTARTCVTRLNRLTEENEQLKHDATVLICSNQEYRKENEQLKQSNKGLQSELQIFKEDVTHSNLQINKLTDENEQLKRQIDELVKGIQDSAKMSADAICKPMNKNIWGDVE